MRQALLYAIQISVVTAITLLSIGTAISEEKGLASPGQSEDARRRVPTRKLTLTVPEQPPKTTSISCCNAHECIFVSEFSVCPAGNLIMVCDSAGICIPISPISVRGKNLLFSK
jgi:hypothetical protein